jgi:predicted RNA-binding Zn ribbon-like protein
MAGFFLIGNNLALDFVNTEIVADGAPLDLLAGIADLAAWAVATDLLTSAQASSLLPAWSERSKGVPPQVPGLRSALKEIFGNLLRGRNAPSESLGTVNEVLNRHKGRVELRKTRAGFEQRLIADYADPRQLLVPIAEAAADLLCHADLRYLRKCENPKCVLIFYDTTKSHRRRWCSMAACGNRAKAASFYRRRQRPGPAGSRAKRRQTA